MESGMNGRKATQVDESWRTEGASDGRRATEVDEGWRNAGDGRKMTAGRNV